MGRVSQALPPRSSTQPFILHMRKLRPQRGRNLPTPLSGWKLSWELSSGVLCLQAAQCLEGTQTAESTEAWMRCCCAIRAERALVHPGGGRRIVIWQLGGHGNDADKL